MIGGGTGAAAHGIDVRETVREALENLRVQRSRSILALLGILIGTASIIAMLNIGHIAQLETLKLFSHLGIDMIQLQASAAGANAPGFDRDVLEKLPLTDPDVLSVTPLANGRTSVTAGVRQADLAIVAMTPALTTLMELPLRAGRAIGRIDDCALVAVLGDGAATALSAPGAELLPGSRIGAGDYVFTVIGILRPMTPQALNPNDYNTSILIPLACARRLLPGSDPTVAIIKLRPDRDVEAVGKRLSERLANPNSTIQVVNAQQLIKTMNQQKQVHSRMLAAIGSISLLVGGIGVMNVMLMSVMERRREIGLRAAIGATPRDLQAMFIVEAAMLALIGGAAGALFGVLVSFIAAKSSGWMFSLALYVLPLGPGMAAIVGLAFGFYPALMASWLDPIEALRAE